MKFGIICKWVDYFPAYLRHAAHGLTIAFLFIVQSFGYYTITTLQIKIVCFLEWFALQ